VANITTIMLIFFMNFKRWN